MICDTCGQNILASEERDLYKIALEFLERQTRQNKLTILEINLYLKNVLNTKINNRVSLG